LLSLTTSHKRAAYSAFQNGSPPVDSEGGGIEAVGEVLRGVDCCVKPLCVPLRSWGGLEMSVRIHRGA